MDAERKMVLVTGASKGIGRGIAIALSNSGFDVTCHYNGDLEGAKRTVELIGQSTFGKILQFDVGNYDETEAALSRHVDQYGPFWGIVINAGIKKDGSFLTMSKNDWDDVIDTNLHGFFHILRFLVRPMVQLKNGGRIVCISSLSASVGVGGQANYSASKAGMEGAARSLAMELAKRQITVNCVCPGFVETDMLNNMDREAIIKEVPMKRIGTVEDVASMVDYLFSPGASYITKQSIRIDGGIG